MENRSLDAESPRNGAARVAPAQIPLAHRPDFTLGTARVRPSLRTVEGPGGQAIAEPRVMQVLVAMADVAGAVLSRDDLMQRCWPGMVVGDDAITRTITEIRRIARATGAQFKVETIPRIGYRLVIEGAEPALPAATAAPDAAQARPPLARRRLLAAGIAAAAVAAGATWWATGGPRRAPSLVRQARDLLRQEMQIPDSQAAQLLEEALRLTPDDAQIWGLLALARMRNNDPVTSSEGSKQAIEKALALDSTNANALAAQALLQRNLDTWAVTERKLRSVLAIAPDNMAALDALVMQLQASGYSRESGELNDRALSFDGLRPGPLFRKALKLWIHGEGDAADQFAARAAQVWPQHPWVWMAQLVIGAFTGRWQATHDLLDAQEGVHNMLTPLGVVTWRKSLHALERRTSEAIAAAREANRTAARQAPGLAANAIMVLAELGEVDTAYEVIEGLLLRRGPLATQVVSAPGLPVENAATWRNRTWLFTPATASLRRDARFAALAERIGLARYWQERGIAPDARHFRES